MIVKITKEPSPMSGYKKYFMFEAPGDEDENAPKANTKVIKINPDDKRRTDYTKYVPDPDETEPEDTEDVTDDTGDAETTDVPEDTPVDDNPDTTDTTDDVAGDTEAPVDNTTDAETPEQADDNGPAIDDTDYGTGDDQTDTPNETPAEDTTGTTDDTGETDAGAEVQTDDTDYATDTDDGGENTDPDGPAIDDTDYTDGNDEEDGNQDTTDTATDDTVQQDNQNDGLDDPDEKTHKFVLFKKCIGLESALSNYIQKLSGIMSDDLECNHIYKKITNNLKELDEMLHDYMSIKFENATYVQSMLFYQRLLASVGINLDMLRHIRQKEIKMSEEKSKH